MVRTEATLETPPKAPSHAPPDTRYSPGLATARALGWFSLALGTAELLCPGDMARLTGIRGRSLLRLYGLREITSGIGILSSTRPSPWLWSRVLGDVLDLATLVPVISRTDRRSHRAGAAALAVAGVTLVDIAAAAQQSLFERLDL